MPAIGEVRADQAADAAADHRLRKTMPATDLLQTFDDILVGLELDAGAAPRLGNRWSLLQRHRREQREVGLRIRLDAEGDVAQTPGSRPDRLGDDRVVRQDMAAAAAALRFMPDRMTMHEGQPVLLTERGVAAFER